MTVVLGVPHTTETEDIFKGYRIPAGSIIMPNIWYVYYAQWYLVVQNVLFRMIHGGNLKSDTR